MFFFIFQLDCFEKHVVIAWTIFSFVIDVYYKIPIAKKGSRCFCKIWHYVFKSDIFFLVLMQRKWWWLSKRNRSQNSTGETLILRFLEGIVVFKYKVLISVSSKRKHIEIKNPTSVESFVLQLISICSWNTINVPSHRYAGRLLQILLLWLKWYLKDCHDFIIEDIRRIF